MLNYDFATMILWDFVNIFKSSTMDLFLTGYVHIQDPTMNKNGGMQLLSYQKEAHKKIFL